MFLTRLYLLPKYLPYGNVHISLPWVLELNNFRPISIICSTAKLIYDQLSYYLNKYSVLSPFQSGFRSNHSTTTALLKLTTNIFSASNDSKLTGAIFIDLTKAFNLVDHYLLLG